MANDAGTFVLGMVLDKLTGLKWSPCQDRFIPFLIKVIIWPKSVDPEKYTYKANETMSKIQV
jgi:hypothetical protein